MNSELIISRLPHKPPMLMIDRILNIGKDSAQTKNIINKDNPFLDENGSLAAAAGIEIMAQTAASFLVAKSIEAGSKDAALGFIMGIDSFKVFRSLQAEEEVDVNATLTHNLDNYFIFETNISIEQGLIIEGRIKIYVPS